MDTVGDIINISIYNISLCPNLCLNFDPFANNIYV